MFKKRIEQYIRSIVEQEKPLYTISEKVAQIKDISFNEDEKKLLSTLGQSKQFSSIIEKLIFGIHVQKVYDTSEEERISKVGGVKALDALRKITTMSVPQQKIDYRTGKNIS